VVHQRFGISGFARVLVDLPSPSCRRINLKKLLPYSPLSLLVIFSYRSTNYLYSSRRFFFFFPSITSVLFPRDPRPPSLLGFLPRVFSVQSPPFRPPVSPSFNEISIIVNSIPLAPSPQLEGPPFAEPPPLPSLFGSNLATRVGSIQSSFL